MLATITELNDVVDALQVRAEAFNTKLQALWGVCWKQIPLVVPYDYKQGTSVVEDSDGHAPES